MRELSRQQVITYVLVAVVVGLIGLNYLKQGRGVPAQASRPAAASSPVKVERGGARIVVHVAGAVRHPGIYRLGGGRVADAVRHAGGGRADADLGAINLAAKLADGQQVLVPSRQGGGNAGSTADAKVSLSSATADELDGLDGVGEATAQKILAYRQRHGFTSAEDLMQIPGIGEKKFEALKEQIQP